MPAAVATRGPLLSAARCAALAWPRRPAHVVCPRPHPPHPPAHSQSVSQKNTPIPATRADQLADSVKTETATLHWDNKPKRGGLMSSIADEQAIMNCSCPCTISNPGIFEEAKQSSEQVKSMQCIAHMVDNNSFSSSVWGPCR